MDLVEERDQRVERAARSALDQEHSRERRDVAAEEIAQTTILRDRRIMSPIASFFASIRISKILWELPKPALTREACCE